MHTDGAGDIGLRYETEERKPGLESLGELNGRVEPGFRCSAPPDMYQQIDELHLLSPCPLCLMR
jgi:hypothetical protein